MLAATGPLLKSRNGRIYSELLNNSYPKKFIDRVKTRITNQAQLARNWTSTVCFPYVRTPIEKSDTSVNNYWQFQIKDQ